MGSRQGVGIRCVACMGRAVYLKGGHLPESEDAVDVFFDGKPCAPLGSPAGTPLSPCTRNEAHTVPHLRSRSHVGLLSLRVAQGLAIALRPSVPFPGTALQELRAARVLTANTHGTGCSLSAAVAARLALGEPLPAAVQVGLLPALGMFFFFSLCRARFFLM